MDTIQITVRINGISVERHYELVDGQAPENMQENIQDMVDTLLDNEEKF